MHFAITVLYLDVIKLGDSWVPFPQPSQAAVGQAQGVCPLVADGADRPRPMAQPRAEFYLTARQAASSTCSAVKLRTFQASTLM